MKRIPPSQRLREEIERLLEGAAEDQQDLLGQLVRLGAERLLQEALEEEVTDFLDRDYYERQAADQPHRGWRNGYRPARLETAEGRLEVQAPQVRQSPEPYRSRLLAFLRQHTDILERLAVEMYTRGLSTRDIEDAFREVTGERLMSRSAVSRLTERLWEEYQASASGTCRALRWSTCSWMGCMRACGARQA